jgi:hypothetical protein
MRMKAEPIGADYKVNVSGWENAIRGLMTDQVSEARDYFEQSISGFHNHSVSITQRGTASIGGNGSIEIIVGVLDNTPDNAVYSYVNWGTSPRVITAVNDVMIFRANYMPATARGTLRSGKWTKTGPWLYKYEVNHPGIKARRFDEFIQEAMRGSMTHGAKQMLSSQKGKMWRR